MSKLLNATCTAGVVTADGLPVPGVEILSQGVAASTGFLILDEDRKYYVARTSPDLKSALDKLTLALNSITSAMSGVTSVLGALGGNPIAIAAITAQNSAAGVQVAQIEILKEALK